MKLVATHDVQVGLHIYRKGEVCEWDGVVDERMAANFKGADGSALKVKGIGNREKGIGADGSTLKKGADEAQAKAKEEAKGEAKVKGEGPKSILEV